MCSEIAMRKILSGLAVGLVTAQLLVISPLPSYAAGPPGPRLAASDTTQIVLPTGVRKSKASSIKIKIDPMSNVKRGATNV
jgi:hypothetical protein